jgi:hypothetical protein
MLGEGEAMTEQKDPEEKDTEQKVWTETLEVRGEELLAKVKEIIHEGNVRRVIILNEDGERLIEIPLTLGVVGALLLPTLAALGAMAALLANCTIEIERVDEQAD